MSNDTNTLQVGNASTYERTFSAEDVRIFGELSGDQGTHHMIPDEQGRVMVQGLLTATLPTKLGGDISYIARKFDCEFLRPVFVGDTVRCGVTIVALEPANGYLKMSANWACQNQYGKEVMRGTTSGVIRISSPEVA
jgi:3-hydroxybutyryl-CoA dehydratase